MNVGCVRVVVSVLGMFLSIVVSVSRLLMVIVMVVVWEG